MVFFTYADRPGIIGKVGTILGDARDQHRHDGCRARAQGGEALMALTVDSEVPPEVLDRVATVIEASNIRAVTLV